MIYGFVQGQVYPERKEQVPFPRWRRGRRVRPAPVLTQMRGGADHRGTHHRPDAAARYYPRGYVAAAPDLSGGGEGAGGSPAKGVLV